ncbi:MAG TPA: glycoside hydrolase family 92 protein, partial [Bacteroidetes bacterium]|nr:glycoside hydrolase family 92 protein [Bacteroidota bacterium]
EEPVLVKVALSAISAQQALRDLHVEAPDWDFDAVRRETWRAWSDLLSRVEVEGREEDKRLFYTGLYRACTMPFNTTSSDGTYRGTDGRVHEARDHVHYDTYSIWDTFRTKYPLLSLVAPDFLRDIVHSLVDIYRDGGQQWPFLDVRHEHTGAILLDAYRKGITDFDLPTAYAGMKQDALRQLPDEWEKLGYIPERPDRTLEAAYDDWCVAEMARIVGRNDDAERFSRRAEFYRNVWDDSLRFFRARDASGRWLPFPQDPTAIDERYVYEGSMWQWRWFVLHDVPGLIQLFGGPESFVRELRYFFDHDLYNHGNQPDLHAPFLFNFAGAPELTQQVVTRILTEPVTQRYGTHGFLRKPVHRRIYRPTPDGFIPEMDDDCGTMWAWYAMSAMGLYQVCPGNPVYQITTPVFRKVVLHLDAWGRSGKTFVIVTRGISPEHPVIREARLGGKKLERMEIAHEAITSGGRLELFN